MGEGTSRRVRGSGRRRCLRRPGPSGLGPGLDPGIGGSPETLPFFPMAGMAGLGEAVSAGGHGREVGRAGEGFARSANSFSRRRWTVWTLLCRGEHMGGMERCREPEVRTVAGKPHRCKFSGSSLPLLVCHTFAGVVVSGSSAHGIGGATGMTCGGFMAVGRAQATNHCQSQWRWRAAKQSAEQVPCTQGRCPGCFAAPTPPLQEMFFAAGGLVTSRFPTGSTTYPGLPKESARFSLTPPAQPRQGARVASTATRTATLSCETGAGRRSVNASTDRKLEPSTNKPKGWSAPAVSWGGLKVDWG
jgi:hypothetical protein